MKGKLQKMKRFFLFSVVLLTAGVGGSAVDIWSRDTITNTTYPTIFNDLINVSTIKVNNKEVCLYDGTGCELFPHAEQYISNNNLSTTINGANQWALVNGTWIAEDHYYEFNISNGMMTYTGNSSKLFHIAVTLSVKSSGANDVMRAGVFKNGVLLNASQVQQKLGGVGDVGSTAIHVAPVLANNDSIDLRILNEVNGNDYTITYANMFAMGIRHH